MNEQQQAELRALREEQRALTSHLRALDERLLRFERRAADEVVAAGPGAVPTLPPRPVPALVAEMPPPLPILPALTAAKLPPPGPVPPVPAVPPAVPPSMPSEMDGDLRTPSGPSAPMASAPAATARKTESLEMRIGSTWLVYAGVVLALTALAFFGNYLYHNIVPHLGPVAKIVLLYGGVGALTGAAARLERSRQARENPRLRTYAQTVLAAGLAGIYYVTYAAHYFENLRVIQSGLVAGAALLAWTAFMVFLAHRRNSETLATVAILLAYYASAINEGVAAFTLFANLALTGGVVFLLRRHLWRVFPFASLLATFGSYGFWTYYHSVLGWRGELGAPPVHAQHGPGGFWIEAVFLAVYWVLFTWAAFTAEERALPSFRRAGFVSLNNGAFYGLVTWLVLGEGPGGFWKWSLGLGMVLLALAEACRRRPRPADPRTEDAYLLQGVLLVTTGFVAYFEGWQLGLVLAAEAVTLLAAAGRRSSRLLLGCSLAAAALAFGWSVRAFVPPASAGPWVTPLGVGVLLVGAASLAQRLRSTRPAGAGNWSFGHCLDPLPSYYSLLGSLVWLLLIGERIVGHDAQILTCTGAALALTASVYALRIKALPVYAQGFLGAAFLDWLLLEGSLFSADALRSGWTTVGLLASTLVLGHWWQRLPGSAVWNRGKFSFLLNAVDAVAVVMITFLWFQNKVWWTHGQGGVRVAEAAALALGLFAYAVATRYPALGVVSQALLIASVAFFADLAGVGWSGSVPELLLASVPFWVVLAMLAGTRYFVPSGRAEHSFVQTGLIAYEILATLLFLAWTDHYLPTAALLPVYAAAGAAVFALGVERRAKRWLLLSAAPTLAGLWAFLLLQTGREHANLLNVLGVAFLAGEQQFGRRRLGDRLPRWFPDWAQTGLMVAAVGCAWVFVTARVERWQDTSVTLAAGWSIFAAAVFAAGWFLRERVYRWLALLVMAATLGHIAWFDLTRLDSLGKAISFFVLAAVLLGVGFLYNRYQDKFRDLL